jgi:hypothetical protein
MLRVQKAKAKLHSVFREMAVFMLRIVVGFLIRLIGQHQRPNYLYSTLYPLIAVEDFKKVAWRK